MLRTLLDSAVTHCLLAIVFSITTAGLFMRLFPPRDPVMLDLRAIQGNYSVSYQNHCFGTVRVWSELTDELTTLKTDGTFYLQQKGNTLPVTTTGEVNFNILGQFGNALLSFDLAGNTIRMGALGVDPIQVIIHSFQGEKSTFQREFSVPGPIVAKRTGNLLAIDYAGFSGRQAAVPAIGMTVAKQEEGSSAPSCADPLSLDAVVRNLLATLPQLPIPFETMLKENP